MDDFLTGDREQGTYSNQRMVDLVGIRLKV